MSNPQEVLIKDLNVDQQVQLRSRWIDNSTVSAYVEALAQDAEFPPIIVYHDGDTYWVADGFHRIAAYRFLGLARIKAEVRHGDKEDAMIYAATANVTNGKPMSQKEKQEAGKRLIKLTNWSNREIARRLAVGEASIRRWKKAVSAPNDADKKQVRTVTRNGKEYEMDVSNIGDNGDKKEQTPDMFDGEPKVERSCLNCIHHKHDRTDYNRFWCDQLEKSFPLDFFGAPCELEFWQDDGSYVEESISTFDRHNLSTAKFPKSIELLHADFADAGAELEPESFDLVITDPPYGEDNVHLYGLLAKEAARLLKPGGSLLAMTGQLCLPDVLDLMIPHLTYHWTISYDTPGGQSPQIWPRKVNSFWKPIFWFVKDEYDGAWRGDKIKSDVNDNDKRFHEWGQSESGIGKLVSEFASVGTGRVLDPFLGGGTTAVVCYRLRIPFVGIDKDKEAIETTKHRILMEVGHESD